MHEPLLTSDFTIPAQAPAGHVRGRSGRRTRTTCRACDATVRRTFCAAHDPDPDARRRAHAARVAAHQAKVGHADDTPGTRSAERDLLADGLGDIARTLRARGQRAEADALEDKARRVRWQVPA